MAQTIVDVLDYLADHPDLGFFTLDRQHVKGHKEWAGDDRVCPDGISVDRIVIEAQALAVQPPPPTSPLTMPDLDPVLREGTDGKRYIVPYVFGTLWDRHGLDVFGYWISGVLEERGRLVQYTERARFEYAPDIPGNVQLGLVGLEVFAGRHPDML
jgi:hypothetical protein